MRRLPLRAEVFIIIRASLAGINGMNRTPSLKRLNGLRTAVPAVVRAVTAEAEGPSAAVPLPEAEQEGNGRRSAYLRF